MKVGYTVDQVNLELGYIVVSFFKEELGWIEVIIDDRLLVQGGKGSECHLGAAEMRGPFLAGSVDVTSCMAALMTRVSSARAQDTSTPGCGCPCWVLRACTHAPVCDLLWW